MKKHLSTSIRLTLAMLVLCCVVYFSIVALIANAAPGKGSGEKILVDGKVVGYELVGQKFNNDTYFWGRPSAVDYNAAGSAGSNKGPSNPDYLQIVKDQIDTFLVHNPSIKKEDIPAELVTASGSGLDPHISPAAATIQVKRIAATRGSSEQALLQLINEHTQTPVFGPAVVHVLKLNIALDKLK